MANYKATVAEYAKEITLKAMEHGLFNPHFEIEQNAQNVCKFYNIVFEELHQQLQED